LDGAVWQQEVQVQIQPWLCATQVSSVPAGMEREEQHQWCWFKSRGLMFLDVNGPGPAEEEEGI